jgi:quercetin dioxygenase-like cupin family protein
MSSMDRTIEGDVLVNHLTADDLLIDKDLLARHGRTARTLVKDGPLRLTYMAIAPGGTVPSHSTTGPVTIQVTEGNLLFRALDREYPLATGDVLVLAAGVEHSATSEQGGSFLLTVFHPPSPGSRVPFDDKS